VSECLRICRVGEAVEIPFHEIERRVSLLVLARSCWGVRERLANDLAPDREGEFGAQIVR
jgi:hypothetical protein